MCGNALPNGLSSIKILLDIDMKFDYTNNFDLGPNDNNFDDLS